jgi:ketosteroid isomerase-like protein
MLRRMLPVLVVAFVAVSAGAGDSADVLKQADLAFCEATRARGLEGWMSFFADDAVLAQEKPPVLGREALRGHYQGLFALKDLDFRWTPQHAELFPAGILGYTSGRYIMAFTREGKRVTRSGSYLTVWKKGPDGEWKVLSDFGSPDPN